MKLKNFCTRMENQIKIFQASVDRINNILEENGNQSKEKIIPIVEVIRTLLTELQLHEEQLEKECPFDWSYAKTRMDDLVGQIESGVDRFWDEIPQGFISAKQITAE